MPIGRYRRRRSTPDARMASAFREEGLTRSLIRTRRVRAVARPEGRRPSAFALRLRCGLRSLRGLLETAFDFEVYLAGFDAVREILDRREDLVLLTEAAA